MISGTGWMAPQLAVLLEDPYDAVRYIANRSLLTLPGYENWSFDFLGSPQDRAEARRQAISVWNRLTGFAKVLNDAVLLDADGNLQETEQQRLLKRRSDREVYLRE